jgi:alkylhydroperoxidase family enzyme
MATDTTTEAEAAAQRLEALATRAENGCDYVTRTHAIVGAEIVRARAVGRAAVRILETLALLVVGTWHALRPRRQRPAPENRTYPRPLPVAPEWAKPKERRP